MQFDDRLATVLRMRAQSDAARRIQLRQLVDLLGICPTTLHSPVIDAAYARLAELVAAIPLSDSAHLLRDPALRLRSPRLVAALGGGDARLAAAALQRAELHEEEWLDLIPALPAEARQALHQRRDLPAALHALLVRLGARGRGLPPAPAAASAAPPAPQPDAASGKADSEPAPAVATSMAAAVPPDPAPAPAPVAATRAPSAAAPAPVPLPPANDQAPAAAAEAIPPAPGERIGAIVKRIEAYRRARQVVDGSPDDAPRLPLGEEHVLRVAEQVRACDFAADVQGRICWSDAGVAPMLLGQRLDGDPRLARLIRRHLPLTAQTLTLTGAAAIAGAWQVDAMPWFDPLGGRFMGYRGRLRRPAPAAAAERPAPVHDSEADRIRQMLHELRTPVNAIQVGAEIIQQQLYGPSPHEYRSLAAGIAGDAARILAAFEELERLAKLSSGALDLEAGSADLAAVVTSTAGQLDAHTKARGSGFVLRIETDDARVALAPLELERIVWRLLATLAGTSAPGEQLAARLRTKAGQLRLDLALPANLAKLDDKALYAAGPGAVPQVIAAGMFGTGFALRLARAEAAAAGGDLKRKGDRLRLTLPGLTAASRDHTGDDSKSERGAA